MEQKRILPTTLLIVIKDNKILLACKKRGFGIGKYNGVGGKLEPGENVEQGMLRETFEEIGILPKNYTLVGVIDFDEYYKGEPVIEKTHIYIANDYEYEPQESDEMKPFWFDLDKIPYDKMFPDDRIWFPTIMAGDKIVGEFVFDKDFNKLSHYIKIVDDAALNNWVYKGE